MVNNNKVNKKVDDKKLIKVLLEQITERDYLIISLKSNIEDLEKAKEIQTTRNKKKEKKYKHTIYILVCLLLLSILINILSIMYL